MQKIQMAKPTFVSTYPHLKTSLVVVLSYKIRQNSRYSCTTLINNLFEGEALWI
jgi:hypothetical protein